MKYYLTLFETTAAYNAATLDLPNVSLIEENMNVTYNPYVAPETRIVATFNVTSTSSSTQLCNSSTVSQFSAIEIDGVTQQSVISAYTFSTIGEHTVKYILTDPTSIGSSAFQGCTSLTNIDIPSSVTTIGSSAFYNCTSLTSIDIPSGVTTISANSFYNCTSLTSIVIPSGITSIGNFTFYGCSGLTSINIPSGVTSIGMSAFYSCSSLASIVSNATTASTIQSNTFRNVNTGGTLTVQAGSTGYDVWMRTSNYYLGKYNWTKVEQ